MKTRLSLVFFILLLLLPAFLHSQNLAVDKGIIVISLYTAFAIALLLLPLAFMRPLLFGYLMTPFLLLMPFELLHVINYDGYTTLAGVTSAIETNPGELTEFIHSYRHYVYISYPFIILALILFYKNVKPDYRLATGTRITILLAFIGTLSIFTVKNTYDLYARNDSNITHGLKNLYNRLFYQNYPFSHLLKLRKYMEQNDIVKQTLAAKKDFQFGATADTELLQEQLPVVVLVIGETSRAHNWQLGDYTRKTNPNLIRRRNLYYFDNTVSAATHTSQTIKLVLSRATPRNLKPTYNEKSILSAFKEAGYKTVWLSNQNMTGGVETSVYAIATEAEESEFSVADYRVQPKMDEELLPSLQKILQDNSDTPLFIIIHTMGSHEVYRMRYPKSYEKFRPASRGDDYNFSSPGIRERILNSYDNSILYTDYVLDQIINTVSNSGRISSVSFFSDHGENLLDDKINRFGHGGVIPTLYVTDVPMFIWTSQEFEHINPEMVDALNINKSKPVSSLYLFDTLLDIGGINIKGHSPDFSLVDIDFKPSKRYILNTNYEPLKYSIIKNSIHNTTNNNKQ